MIYLVLLFAEIGILFLLSRFMGKSLSEFMSTRLIFLIFLPGVVIHELAHFLIAGILLVPVGEMEFVPRKTGNAVRLGSVEIAKTDPIRRSLIGFAPVFVGFVIVVGIVYLFSSNVLFFQDKGFYFFAIAILALVYLLFAISNTMFSSAKDMEGTLEVILTFLIILGIAYLLGFRLPWFYLSRIFTQEVVGIIQKSAIFLLTPIVVDLGILGAIRMLRRVK